MNKNGQSDETQIVSHRVFASDTLVKIAEIGQSLGKGSFEATLASLFDELSGLDVLDPLASKDGFPDLQHIQNCLKVLEVFITGTEDASLPPETRLKQEESIPLLTKLFHSLMMRSRTDHPPIGN